MPNLRFLTPRFFTWFLRGLPIICAVCFVLASPLRASEDPKATPPFTRIGLIPPQIQGETELEKDVESSLARDFSQIVRESQRFLPLNDEVVADLWHSADGRARLVNEFELDAYLGLSMAQKGPTLSLGVRLLGHQLENYIVEYESVETSVLNSATAKERRRVLQDLVYRVINRLPLDVTVTSIQGKYITLAGGQRQGLKEGQIVDMVRSFVTSTHPASQSWISYSYKKRGTVRIIEVNANSAVAEITEQTEEQAIQIGDGAQVDALKSRQHYQPVDEAQASKGHQENGPILVPDGGDDRFLKVPPEETKPTTPKVPGMIRVPQRPKKADGDTSDVSAGSTKNADQVGTKAVPPPSDGEVDAAPKAEESDQGAIENADTTPPPPSDSGIMRELGQHFETMTLGIGHQVWNVSGSANAAAAMPAIIMNTANIGFTKGITDDIKAQLLGEYATGPANKGSFSGFVLEGRTYFLKKMEADVAPITFAKIGALVRFDSIEVSGSSYGGRDYLQLGGWIGVDGKTRIDELAKVMEFSAQFRFIPMTSGQIGIKGKKKDVQSSSVMEFGGEGLFVESSSRWRYGARLDYSSGNHEISKGSVSESRFYIGGVMKHAF